MENTVLIFSDRLGEVMKERHVTQYALSKATGIPQATISRYLGCKREIGICNLALISQTLGVSSDYLLGLSDY